MNIISNNNKILQKFTEGDTNQKKRRKKNTIEEEFNRELYKNTSWEKCLSPPPLMRLLVPNSIRWNDWNAILAICWGCNIWNCNIFLYDRLQKWTNPKFAQRIDAAVVVVSFLFSFKGHYAFIVFIFKWNEIDACAKNYLWNF